MSFCKWLGALPVLRKTVVFLPALQTWRLHSVASVASPSMELGMSEEPARKAAEHSCSAKSSPPECCCDLRLLWLLFFHQAFLRNSYVSAEQMHSEELADAVLDAKNVGDAGEPPHSCRGHVPPDEVRAPRQHLTTFLWVAASRATAGGDLSCVLGELCCRTEQRLCWRRGSPGWQPAAFPPDQALPLVLFVQSPGPCAAHLTGAD